MVIILHLFRTRYGGLLRMVARPLFPRPMDERHWPAKVQENARRIDYESERYEDFDRDYFRGETTRGVNEDD